MFLLCCLLLSGFKEPKRPYPFSKQRSAQASHQFWWELQVLRPVKVRILQASCLHTYFEPSLFNLATAWIRAWEENKLTLGQKAACQAWGEPSPRKAGEQQSQVECELLFLTIQWSLKSAPFLRTISQKILNELMMAKF